MGLFDTVMNVATGGLYGVAQTVYETATGGGSGGAVNSAGSAIGSAVGSVTDALGPTVQDPAIVQSNNMLAMTQINADTQRLAIDQNAQNSQLMTQAWLTERLDSNDTKLAVATEKAKAEFQAQSDRHVERMEELRLEGIELQRTMSGGGSGSPDIPPPDWS